MSHTHPAIASSSSSSPSSNFQLIINNALDTYEKRTRKDLRTDPLAVQLQSCDSPGAILAVLQQQVQGLDQFRNTDERWTKWLDPTVNVLYTFSNIIGAGVGMVCFRTYSSEICSHIYVIGFLTSACHLCWSRHPPLGVYILVNFIWAIVTHTFLRQLKMFGQVKTLLSTSLSG